MKKRVTAIVLLALAAAAGVSVAHASEQDDYNQRAAARDTALFDALDRNRDGNVTRDEAHGDLDFFPRFDDMDINRDGVVTRAELERYIAQRYGVNRP